eukprot:1516338-Rhodomonas_salina.2
METVALKVRATDATFQCNGRACSERERGAELVSRVDTGTRAVCTVTSNTCRVHCHKRVCALRGIRVGFWHARSGVFACVTWKVRHSSRTTTRISPSLSRPSVRNSRSPCLSASFHLMGWEKQR